MNKFFIIISILLIGGCSTVAGVGKDVICRSRVVQRKNFKANKK